MTRRELDDLDRMRLLIHLPTGSWVVTQVRKDDDSGWWLVGGGGLADNAALSDDWIAPTPDQLKRLTHRYTGPDTEAVGSFTQRCPMRVSHRYPDSEAVA